MKKLSLLLLAVFCLSAWTHAEENHTKKTTSKEAHEKEGDKDHEESEHAEGKHEDEDVSSNVGPGKAVIAADEHDGIQLSEKARKTLELDILTVKGQAPYLFPVSSAVHTKDEAGIYRQRGEWLKFIEGSISSLNEFNFAFTPKVASDLKAGDAVVVRGVPLLRVADLEAFGGSGEGHGH